MPLRFMLLLVPGSERFFFFIADCLLALDRKLGKALIQVDANSEQTKASLACADGKRLKRLVGSLRHLFRNSP